MSDASENEDFNAARAELFEALGHPVRIQILEALTQGPLSFSKLKATLGIESSGHLSFHLGKLKFLVKVDANGNYTLAEDGKEALRLASIAIQSTHEGRPSIKHSKIWSRGQGFKWLLAFLAIGLISGSVFTLVYGGSLATRQTTSGLLFPECSVPSNQKENSTYVTGTVNYPPQLLGFIYNQLQKKYASVGSQDYIDVLSPTYFNSSVLAFDFLLMKNSHFNPEQYGGNLNSSNPWAEYPAEIRMGTEGGLLFISVQVMYLYGSPYGNATSGGDNFMVLFAKFGNSTYGFGPQSGTGPGPYLPGSQSPDGWYFDESYNEGSLSGNLSYYVGPQSFENPMNGSLGPLTPQEENASLVASTWLAAGVLGTYDRPVMTRYLYVMNMSDIPAPQTSKAEVCPDLRMMFSLQTYTPFPILESNGMANFLTLIDNFPTHDILAPFNIDSYLNVYVKSQYPIQKESLVSHSVVLLKNFVYNQNLTYPANQTHLVFNYPLTSFNLAYPGYIVLNGTSSGSWLGFGIGYNYTENFFFGPLTPYGFTMTVSAGNVTLLAQALGVSGPLTANITVVYHYWTP